MVGLARRALAEAVGSAFLVATVVGSGIAAQRLSPDDAGLQLMENAVATGAGLVAIILAVGPVSGAHLNPAVSLVDWLLGGLSARELGAYTAAQVGGGTAGCVLANAMFSVAIIWFTSSTSFANPAVTLGRTLSDTFAGIAPASAPAFVGCQLVGALLAAGLVRLLYPNVGQVTDRVAVPSQPVVPVVEEAS